MSSDFIKAIIADDMRAVDHVIRARLHSDVVLVSQVAEYIIQSGGKRLRPVLLLLAAGACHYQTGTHHHELAAVVEFIHTATLLHDDVVDESDLRRGNPTANAAFGNAASVLVGDFLYSRAFQMMVSCNNMRVMAILAEATNIIAEGEVLQLMNIHNAEIDEADYLQVIRYKTAKLFEAACRLGAVISEQPPEIETALADYGMHLGTAFQIVDDILDYTGDAEAIGKNVGDDLAEGKPTLPLIYLLHHGETSMREKVKIVIEQGGREHFDAVLHAVQTTPALDYSRQKAQEAADAACDALAILPESPYKEALKHLALSGVSRTA